MVSGWPARQVDHVEDVLQLFATSWRTLWSTETETHAAGLQVGIRCSYRCPPDALRSISPTALVHKVTT